MKKKRSVFAIIAALIIAALCIGAAGIFLIPRLQAGKMMEDMVADWRSGRLGSVGEDFRDVPGELLVQFMPEIRDPELEELFRLYEYPDSESREWFKIFRSDGASDREAAYEEEYAEAWASEEEDPASTDDGNYSDDGKQKVFDAIYNGIEVSYELPLTVRFPMEIELTVAAPSIEDAYLSAGKGCSDKAEMWKAMADYIESGKAEMLTETRTVIFHESGNKVYPEPDPYIANVLTGGYADYMARLLDL